MEDPLPSSLNPGGCTGPWLLANTAQPDKKKGQSELSQAIWESQATSGSPQSLDLGDSIDKRINILLVKLLSTSLTA